MECFHCKGQMIRGNAPFSCSADRNDYHISWKAVPAWVCSQCGEALFEDNEVGHIQNALQQVDKATVFLNSKLAEFL